MAQSTQSVKYDVEDSNIALLGSEIEERVREAAGDKETAWQAAGKAPGVQVWRIEKFHVTEWPKERFGSFYDGDSYIVLHTYKQGDTESLSYDLHFWLGKETSQDEAATAAYKTVELDDHLQGRPIQYREVQSHESPRFLSYFPRFVCLHGGVSTGFHHVLSPPLDKHKLYKISLAGRTNLVVHEVPALVTSVVEGDVYVLDKGTKVWQFNSTTSVGKEKFKAAEFVQSLVDAREGRCEVTVFDEGVSGAGIFLLEIGGDASHPQPKIKRQHIPLTLFRLSDGAGSAAFEAIQPFSRSSLTSSDAFLLDNAGSLTHPAIYAWLGTESRLNKRHLTLQYAQSYLHSTREKADSANVAIPIIKMNEGAESAEFISLITAAG